MLIYIHKYINHGDISCSYINTQTYFQLQSKVYVEKQAIFAVIILICHGFVVQLTVPDHAMQCVFGGCHSNGGLA